MMEDKNWTTETLKEAPFYYDGITPQEYDEEMEYFESHFELYQKGQYKPLREIRNNKNAL